MATLIIILNQDHVITHPCVYVVRNGRHGSSTSLGYDQSEARALQIAEQYKSEAPGAEIVNLYNYRPTAKQYFDYIQALDRYYTSWEDHPRYNEEAPDLMSACAEIKRQIKAI